MRLQPYNDDRSSSNREDLYYGESLLRVRMIAEVSSKQAPASPRCTSYVSFTNSTKYINSTSVRAKSPIDKGTLPDMAELQNELFAQYVTLLVVSHSQTTQLADYRYIFTGLWLLLSTYPRQVRFLHRLSEQTAGLICVRLVHM